MTTECSNTLCVAWNVMGLVAIGTAVLVMLAIVITIVKEGW